MSIEQNLRAKLQQRADAGNLRQLSLSPPGITDFCSNDYLGLARNPTLHQRIQAAYATANTTANGATGSRLISGNSLHYNALERTLAGLFGAEKALIFNAGYTANTAILSAIPQRGDTIIFDEYSHASLKEGARLSFAQRFAFRHNDLADLEKKLQKATGDVFVVAESVYSMDGDFAPLADLLVCCEKYGANLIWDEAHSTGTRGKGGNGLACELALEHRTFARIYTFGKGPGVHGACIAGSGLLIDYLINFARPLIYTTALPLHSLVSIAQSFAYLGEYPDLQDQLHAVIQRFRQQLNAYPALMPHFIHSLSPIQAIKTGGNARTRKLAGQLQTAGFDVRPILSPTVREGEERLRICLHVYNTEAETAALLHQLNTIFHEEKHVYPVAVQS